MKKTGFILTLCLLASITSFGQEQDATNRIADLKLRFEQDPYQLPPHDFVVLSSTRGNTGEYTLLQLDKEELRKSIESTRLMGSMPPVFVTFYNKGIKVREAAASFQFFPPVSKEQAKLFPQKKLVKKTKTFLYSGDYERARKSVSAKGNTYILEEESNGCNLYFYVVIPDKKDPDSDFYRKLLDMKKHFYKGEFFDYFFDSFESFDYYASASENLYRLKIYYYEYFKKTESEKVFTRKECENIFGCEWLLRSSKIFENNEYILTWYEYKMSN